MLIHESGLEEGRKEEGRKEGRKEGRRRGTSNRIIGRDATFITAS